MNKRPSFQFYPADWRKDVELRSCSISARGLWIEMMCIAHECAPYGHLTVNGKPMTINQIAGLVGLPATQAKRLIEELISNGVARMTPDGVIYSKRMIDDESRRNRCSEGGKAGSEHGFKGAKFGSMGGRPKSETVDKTPLEPPLLQSEEPPLKPPPSSSFPERKQQRVAALSPEKLIGDGLSNDLAVEFLAHRNRKKAVLTPRAWASIKVEAGKAGMTPAAVAERCIARGWTGFDAEWVAGSRPAVNGAAFPAPVERTRSLAEMGLEDV